MFPCYKFQTMVPDAEEKLAAYLAAHPAAREEWQENFKLAHDPRVTKFGAFLRRTSLDELPQIVNVLKGEMSLVGPRPNLYNQHELIAEREALGVYAVRPGITGLAQVSGIDMSTPHLLAETDARMIQGMSVRSYFRYIVQTLAGKGAGDRVG